MQNSMYMACEWCLKQGCESRSGYIFVEAEAGFVNNNMCAEFVHCGKVLYMVLGRFTTLCIKFFSHITAKNSFSNIRVV